ncbi:MAG: ABC transporter permease [Cyclobacteriaceae bacterium]|nr:ABC transporter permease [Cyclobacteriaceae bacterium]
MRNESLHPPKWPLKLLRLFIREQYLEEIEGDMEEIFFDNVERYSVRKAIRIYTWEMIKLLRPGLIRQFRFLNSFNRFGMLSNYFKVSIRGLMKNPLNSFINLFGLASAIGICMFSYAIFRWTYDRDQFHENKNSVYLVTAFAPRNGTMQEYGRTPRPLAESLQQDFPQIEKVCRVEDRNIVVKYHDQVFNERIRLVDPTFLQMFTFPLKWGAAESLKDVNSIVISEPMSEKYFGEQNPVGEILLINFDKDRSKEFKVVGVARKFPDARSMDFTFLAHFDNLRTSESDYNFHDWAAQLNATFIQVNDPKDIKPVLRGMTKYRQLQNEAVSEDFAIDSLGLEQLATLHIKTEDIRDDIFREGTKDNIASIAFLAAISILMLALACSNYINIAIVSVTKRLKELGVRKSIGATRKVIILQFLSENIVTTFFALLIGILLGRFVVIPWFEGLWYFSMDFKFGDVNLWIFLVVVMFFTAIASGIYPALYISRFQPVSILRGSLRFGQKNPITKVFLGFQLVLACVFITSAVIFTLNSDYLAEREWGYSNRDVIYAQLPDELSVEQLKNVMEENAHVISTARSVQHIGRQQRQVLIAFPSQEQEVDMLAVDGNYFNTMGVDIVQGRGFNEHETSDRQGVVVSQTMVERLRWDNPVGEQFKMDSVQYEVIGVVKDFHSYSFSSPLRPTFFTHADKSDYRFLSMKVEKGSMRESYEFLRKKWSLLFPESPFSGGYQEDVWGTYYVQLSIHGHVWRVFASVAVMLALLGVYGLVSLNVSSRKKEFSIKKVLGANIKNISNSIFQQYYLLLGFSLALGTPLSYVVIVAIMDFANAYHMNVTFWHVGLAAILLIFVLLGTISTQVVKVFKTNAVDGLKTE